MFFSVGLSQSSRKETKLFRLYFVQGAKKVSFTACYSGKLYLACTSLKAILTTPNFFYEWDLVQFFCNLNSPKNITCQPGELKMQFTSPIIKSSTRWLLPGHYSVYSLCTLFNIISLELEPLNAFLTTLLLRNMKQTSPMKLIKYLYK